jgi:hypothetical protein
LAVVLDWWCVDLSAYCGPDPFLWILCSSGNVSVHTVGNRIVYYFSQSTCEPP